MFAFLKLYETYFKIAVILAYTAFIWYTHGVYDDHKIVKNVQHQEIKSQNGETNLAKFHQELGKIHEKDNCLSSTIPPKYLSLLH